VFLPSLQTRISDLSSELNLLLLIISIQTFRAWINAQLRVRDMKVDTELKDALKDGLVLISLMEVLSGEKCPEKYHTKITLDMQRIENTTIAINFITKHVGKQSVSSNGNALLND